MINNQDPAGAAGEATPARCLFLNSNRTIKETKACFKPRESSSQHFIASSSKHQRCTFSLDGNAWFKLLAQDHNSPALLLICNLIPFPGYLFRVESSCHGSGVSGTSWNQQSLVIFFDRPVPFASPLLIPLHSSCWQPREAFCMLLRQGTSHIEYFILPTTTVSPIDSSCPESQASGLPSPVSSEMPGTQQQPHAHALWPFPNSYCSLLFSCTGFFGVHIHRFFLLDSSSEHWLPSN